MIIVSLVIAIFFLVSFLWATKSGQFDDDYTPSIRMLYDDDNNANDKNQVNGSSKV